MTKRIGVDHGNEPGAGRTYHVWFSPRGRRLVIGDEVRQLLMTAFPEIAREKGIGLLEHESHPDHQHLLIDVPNEMALGKAVQYLKGISARKVFLALPGLKADIGHLHLWQRGYGYRWIPPSQVQAVRAYIRKHAALHAKPGTSVPGISTHTVEAFGG